MPSTRSKLFQFQLSGHFQETIRLQADCGFRFHAEHFGEVPYIERGFLEEKFVKQISYK